MKANELRIGNYLNTPNGMKRVSTISVDGWSIHTESEPIPLSEEWLFRFGFSVINENSSGKRYGYVINGIFSSDLTFVYWTTTKLKGRFFRGDLELKSIHQLQNLYYALTGTELILK